MPRRSLVELMVFRAFFLWLWFFGVGVFVSGFRSSASPFWTDFSLGLAIAAIGLVLNIVSFQAIRNAPRLLRKHREKRAALAHMALAAILAVSLMHTHVIELMPAPIALLVGLVNIGYEAGAFFLSRLVHASSEPMPFLHIFAPIPWVAEIAFLFFVRMVFVKHGQRP